LNTGVDCSESFAFSAGAVVFSGGFGSDSILFLKSIIQEQWMGIEVRPHIYGDAGCGNVGSH
jgi:hypothetical protein